MHLGMDVTVQLPPGHEAAVGLAMDLASILWVAGGRPTGSMTSCCLTDQNLILVTVCRSSDQRTIYPSVPAGLGNWESGASLGSRHAIRLCL